MLPTEEELRALRESVLFPYVLTIFDKDKQAIQSASVKFQQPYLDLIERAEKNAHTCMVTNKKYLRFHGIKVYQEERSTVDLKIKYACRGYQDQAVYMLDYLKGETELRVKYYLCKAALEENPLLADGRSN